ncbi:MAG TPA: hypothetical protein VFK02_02595 [Kofleriaceae bacterium]|nr:hypothetical protein [Kofleriaceae bacterium]
MKLAMLLALALVACQASSDDYPPLHGGGGVGGGGGGGGSGSGSDAGAGDAGLALHGRVCRLSDLRNLGKLDKCDPTGVGGLTVTLGVGASTTPGTRTTTTADDGSFAISAPMGAGFTWHVFGSSTSGTGSGSDNRVVTRSAMPFGTDNTIPVILDGLLNQVIGDNGVTVTDLQGSIFVRVLRGVTGVTGVVGAETTTSNEVLYSSDPSKGDIWDKNQTDSAGIVWVPGVPVALATVSLSQQGTPLDPVRVSVEDQTNTFITVELP